MQHEGVDDAIALFNVNPVPRFIPFDSQSNGINRGIGEEPFGLTTRHVPPRLHRRGFPWYGVNNRASLCRDV